MWNHPIFVYTEGSMTDIGLEETQTHVSVRGKVWQTRARCTMASNEDQKLDKKAMENLQNHLREAVYDNGLKRGQSEKHQR